MGFVDLLNEGETEEAWDDIEAWGGEGFNLPDPGEYVFRVNSMKAEKSQSSGKPTLVSEFEIVSTADGEKTSHAGSTVRDWRSLQPKKGCRQRIKALMEACGVGFEGGGFDTEEFLGTEFVATIFHEENPNKRREDGTPYTNARVRNERAA